MRRSLTLTTEAARHPFRASLPPHVFACSGEEAEPVPSRMPWRIEAEDIRHFMMAYCACLFGVSAYIA
ncbi:hypothetical protein VCJ71_04320 [Alteriqipengyuania sp. WL0013]|uniref:hypothetical protein n=1 Tax=Alteriqipengyuania sp. WL0013 TaxID=3110773 RepID=UPI002BB244B5|nr:hypothetical protein [Alteriqipengyuania sp. WL0013]MEB3415285.1 hypothetical protein [Alteriqipengyuania sp. WL0013]